MGSEDVIEDGSELLRGSDNYGVIEQRSRDPEESLVHQEDR